MSEPIEDGGYAFPCAGAEGVNPESEGMSLRDYFAVRATEADIEEFIPRAVGDQLQLGIKFGWVKATSANPPISLWTPELYTRLRYWAKYAHADSMLKARQ